MRRVAFRLPLLDVAVAVALLAVRLVTLAAGVQAGGAVSYALAPLWTLPFAWRRSHPLAVAVLVAGANLIEVGAGGYHNSIIFVVAYLLAPFSLATNAGNAWRMAGGLLALFVAGGVSQAAQPSPHGFTGWSGTLAGDIALILAPFFVGLALRQQRLRAEASGQLAARLAREKEERARTAVAEERSRIARELHDEVAHAMSVIAVQADAAEGALAHDPALVRRPLVAIRETARASLEDMRRVVGVLHGADQADLAPGPGLARVGHLLDQARAADVTVDLQVLGEPVPLPPGLDLAAYRVVQEGLTNVRKHSGARRVDVVIRYGPRAIGIEVTDDGDGSGAGGGSGHGLIGVRERVALLGGEFVAGPRARGFALRVTLPLT